MSVADVAILGVAVALLAISWVASRQKTAKAVRIGTKQFANTLVFFVAIFAGIGLLEALATPAQIQGLLGSGQGVLAPLVAALVGGLAAGPPAAVYPLFGWKFTVVREGLLFASAFVLAPLIEFAIGRDWIDRFRDARHVPLTDQNGDRPEAAPALVRAIGEGDL